MLITYCQNTETKARVQASTFLFHWCINRSALLGIAFAYERHHHLNGLVAGGMLQQQQTQGSLPNFGHFSTPGATETGRKKTVGTRHTLTQYGDWSGPSRPLSSTYTQSTVVWVPIWRGLALQTLPCVNADKLTKPQTTSFSPAQYMLRDVSKHGRMVLIWLQSCEARQKTSTGRLVLWHQVDWRSDLHGCRLLKKKKLPNFTLSIYASDWKVGTLLATLPDTWHYRVSARTGWPGVKILWLGKMAYLICSFYLGVATCTVV